MLPVLGVELLVPHILKKEAGSAGDELVCEVIGARAAGQRTPSGFVVFGGSQAVLFKVGGSLRLQSDVEFSSPSGAASVIHGGNANGLAAWKNAAGRTLKDIEASE